MNKRLERAVERLMRFCATALAFALIAAVLLNFANVTGRYVLGTAILGADEIQIFIMIWITFLGAAIVSWQNQHLRMDALVGYFPPAVVRALRGIERLLVVGLAGFAAYHSCRYAAGMFAIGRTSEAANIPMLIPHSALAAGFILIAFIGLLALFGVRRSAQPEGGAR